MTQEAGRQRILGRWVSTLLMGAAVASVSFLANAGEKEETVRFPWGKEVLSEPCNYLTLADNNEFWYIRYPTEKEWKRRWLERFDPTSGKVTTVAELFKEQLPGPVAVVDDTAWIVLKEGLFKLDATQRNQQIRPEMEIAGIPYDKYNVPTSLYSTHSRLVGELALGEGFVWLRSRPHSGRKKNQLHRIEPAANRAVEIPFESFGKRVTKWGPIAVGEGAFWIASWGHVYSVDSKTGQLISTIQLPLSPRALLVAFGWIWADSGSARQGFDRFHPETYEVQEVELGEDLDAQLKRLESQSLPDVAIWLFRGSNSLWFVFTGVTKHRARKHLWDWWGVEIAPDNARVRRTIPLGTTSAEGNSISPQPVIRDDVLWRCYEDGLYRLPLEPVAGQGSGESSIEDP